MSGFLGAGTRIYTDEASAYNRLPNHSAVIYNWRQYVKEDVHTNGIESHWALLKRGILGTYHSISPKHTQRYADEFSGRHNVKQLDAVERLRLTWLAMVG